MMTRLEEHKIEHKSIRYSALYIGRKSSLQNTTDREHQGYQYSKIKDRSRPTYYLYMHTQIFMYVYAYQRKYMNGSLNNTTPYLTVAILSARTCQTEGGVCGLSDRVISARQARVLCTSDRPRLTVVSSRALVYCVVTSGSRAVVTYARSRSLILIRHCKMR